MDSFEAMRLDGFLLRVLVFSVWWLCWCVYVWLASNEEGVRAQNWQIGGWRLCTSQGGVFLKSHILCILMFYLHACLHYMRAVPKDARRR